jgi:hypothetical protein
LRINGLLISASRKRGARMGDRVGSIADIAEPLLEVARGQAFIRTQPGGWLFVTSDPNDTIFFPTDHVRSGQPRYAWIDQPDGTRFGYLVEGAALDAGRTIVT